MAKKGLTDAELATRLREQLESEEPPGPLLHTAAREFNSNPQPQAAAAYAQLLLRSRDTAHLSEAVIILTTLIQTEKDTTILREHYYHLCIGYYLLGRFDEGLKAADQLIEIDGRSTQCRAVKALLESSYNHEAAVGLAILGGAAAAGSAVVLGGVLLLAKALSSRK